jgi:ATP-dependent protease ClpP protease subunit
MQPAQYREAIKDKRVITLNGEINEDFVEDLHKQVHEVQAKSAEGEVVVRLTTPGGDIVQGLTVYHELGLLHKARGVWLLCHSFVASMGIYIMMAVPRERRVTLPLTSFYPHLARRRWKIDSHVTLNEFSYFLTEQQAILRRLQALEAQLIELLAKDTERSQKDWQEIVQQPRFMDPDEAKKCGLVSAVWQ